MHHNTKQISEQDQKRDSWFSDMVDHLKADHFMLSTNAVTDEKKQMYDTLINGDDTDLFLSSRQLSTRYFIKQILTEYVQAIAESERMPLTLAVGMSDSKLLVWSEIADNDEETENALLLAEAKVNGKHMSHGFFINSTIIEHADHLPVPPHYQTILAQ